VTVHPVLSYFYGTPTGNTLVLCVHLTKSYPSFRAQINNYQMSAWWLTPWGLIPALGRLRWEDSEFEASLGYKASARSVC
jgi:hypothetical protein